jgi:hypothetical protein
MRRDVILAGVVAVLAAIVACSTSSQPPAEGDCVATDAGRCTPIVVGGSSSSGGDGSASCSVSAGDSQCDVCATDSCCTELEQCSALAACQNLLDCEDDCSGSASCITACENQFPTGVSTLQVLSSCVTARCTVCAESGTGDPCGAAYPPCGSGLTCNGLWCTKACVHSTDCAGLGAGGDSSLGTANVCLVTTGGDQCVPSCASGACTDFPGTYCLTTTSVENAAVSVCSPLPEASAGD